MEDLGQRNIKSYDLVRELEDDEADVRLQITQHKPLYKVLFPEWGRLHSDFLNVKIDNDEKTKQVKKVSENNG